MPEARNTPSHETHHLLFKQLLAALRTGDHENFIHVLRTPDGMATIDQVGDTRQCPIYAAIYALVVNGELTATNAAQTAERLHSALRAAEAVVGPDVLDRAVNIINYSHPLEDGRRYHTETVRDLLCETPDIAAHFAGVIRRFHLLSRSDVVREELPFSRRVRGDDEGKPPTRPF